MVEVERHTDHGQVTAADGLRQRADARAGPLCQTATASSRQRSDRTADRGQTDTADRTADRGQTDTADRGQTDS